MSEPTHKAIYTYMCVIFEYIFVTWNNMQVFLIYYADRPPKNEPLLLMLGQHIHSSKMSLKLKKKVVLVLWFKLPLMIFHVIISCHF